MDDETPKWVLRVGIVFTVLLLVACLKSCEEISYHSRGKRANTKVTAITENRSRAGLEGYKIWYEFFNQNSQKAITDSTPVSIAAAAGYAVGDPVEIEYYGEDVMTTSRIRGTGSYFWPAFLLLSVAAFVGTTIVLTVRARR